MNTLANTDTQEEDSDTHIKNKKKHETKSNKHNQP